MSRKKGVFFWTSYSDLMTSMFFVMLVLFVLTVALLHKKVVATQEKLDKIEEIENAINKIDTIFFDYNKEHKKHILNISVEFPVQQASMANIDFNTRSELIKAGISIKKTLEDIQIEFPTVKYLLIIEGQASKDGYPLNYELSYERGLSLRNFWIEENLIDFGENCEVLISGSGTGGSLRDPVEVKNQRFLIHIIPKPGMIEEINK